MKKAEKSAFKKWFITGINHDNLTAVEWMQAVRAKEIEDNGGDVNRFFQMIENSQGCNDSPRFLQVAQKREDLFSKAIRDRLRKLEKACIERESSDKTEDFRRYCHQILACGEDETMHWLERIHAEELVGLDGDTTKLFHILIDSQLMRKSLAFVEAIERRNDLFSFSNSQVNFVQYCALQRDGLVEGFRFAVFFPC